MGTTLNGVSPDSTFDALIKVGDNGPLTTTLKVVGDGLGNDSPLYLATDKIGINEAVDITATSTELNILDGATLSTADLNQLDNNAFNSQIDTPSIIVSGTNGNGHIHLKHQATDPSTNASSTVFFADADGDLSFKIHGGTTKVVATTENLSTLFNKSVDDTDDITVGTTNKFATAAEKTKLGYISVTQAVDLDTMESDTATNNAKVTNATHTGEVTGSSALTVDKTAISNKTAVTPATNDYILIGDTSDSDNLKKALISDLPVSSTNVEILSPATLGSTQNNYTPSMNTSRNVLTIIPIIPSSSFKITGVNSVISTVNVDNGKRIRIYNQSDRLSSTGRLILFERLFSGSGSSAANRFMFPLYNGMPLLLTPDSFVEFQYSTVDNYWHFVYASEWGNPNGFFDCYSDCHANAPFIPTTATAGTVATTSGSILSGTTQKTIGTILHTITTNAGRAYLGTQQSAMYFGGYCALGMARVQFGALADATDDYISYNIFTDGSGGTPVDACSWVYDRSSSTDWRTVTCQAVGSGGGTTSNTVTGFTPSTTVFHTIGVFVNGDSTNVDFFYSADNDTWTFATSHTTNIPSGTARTLGFMTGFSKTAGSGSKTMNTDWLGYKLMMKRGV